MKKNFSKMISFLLTAAMFINTPVNIYALTDDSIKGAFSQPVERKMINFANVTVSPIDNVSYTGGAIKPAITVTYGTAKLKKDIDYTITYKNNVKVGTASVLLKGKGTYVGSKTVKFKIYKKLVQKAFIRLKAGGSYSKYDADGNRKANKITIVQNLVDNYGGRGNLKIYISGKKALDITSRYTLGFDVNLCTLVNGKVYFDVIDQCDNGIQNFHRLYQYNQGKLVYIYNFNYPKNIGVRSSDISKVSGDRIAVKYLARHTSIGGIQWQAIYKYNNNGKISRTSNTFKAIYSQYWTNNWETKRRIPAYKSVNSKQKNFTTNYYEDVKINQYYIKDGSKLYAQIQRKNGATGWFYCTTKYTDYYFTNAHYFG